MKRLVGLVIIGLHSYIFAWGNEYPLVCAYGGSSENNYAGELGQEINSVNFHTKFVTNNRSTGRYMYSVTDDTRDSLLAACKNAAQTNSKVDSTAIPYLYHDGFKGEAPIQEVWFKDKNLKPSSQLPEFKRIVTFGDSLSDTGNGVWNASRYNGALFGYVLPNSRAYWHGHFSNGSVWSEYLGDKLGIPVNNFAVGGTLSEDSKAGIMPGLETQVGLYYGFTDNMEGGDYNHHDTLFTVLIGANDIYGKSHRFTPERVIANVKKGIDKLIANSIKDDDMYILVLGLPDVRKIPAYTQHYKDDVEVVNKDFLDYNQKLVEMVQAYEDQYKDSSHKLHITYFDLYGTLDEIIDNKHEYGFDNVDQGCLIVNSTDDSEYRYEHSRRSECIDPNKFIFWDNLHPTTATHKVFSDKIYQHLIKNYGQPKGTYLKSCESIKYEHGILTANCHRNDPRWGVNSMLNYSKECQVGSTVSNNDGNLQCDITRNTGNMVSDTDSKIEVKKKLIESAPIAGALRRFW